MRTRSVWQRACGLTRTVIEGIEFDEEAEAIWWWRGRRPGRGAGVAAAAAGPGMTGVRVGAAGGGWMGHVQVVLEADAPRVNCPAHGPTVVAVPWARHHAGHTFAFDDTVAWLAVASRKPRCAS